jgi:hypothetical protein
VPGVVLFAGHRRSLAAVRLLALLARAPEPHARVAAVLCTRVFTRARLRELRRRYGARHASKALGVLGRGRGGDRFATERSEMLRRLRADGIAWTTRGDACGALGVPLRAVPDLASPRALALVRGLAPAYGLYTGGGILRAPLLSLFPPDGGVLNAHCGPLPQVRGMQAVEWSLFLGLRPTATVHFIDAGIDTGPIVASSEVPVAREDDLAVLRARVVLAGTDLLASALREGPPLRSRARPNPPGGGRQYFAMAEDLRRIVQARVAAGETPAPCA